MEIDLLSPDYVDAQYLKLELVDPNAPLRALTAIDIAVTYTATQPNGVVLPLERLVTGPSETSFSRHVYRRVVPSTITFTPIEGGTHAVVLREAGHNKWWGAMILDIAGERTERGAA